MKLTTTLQYLNFNDAMTDGPITRSHARLINYKNTAQLALLMLSDEGDTNIDSVCGGPCITCDSERDYFNLNPPQKKLIKKCAECERFAKLFLKLKEQEEQCNQLKKQINYVCQHQQHQKLDHIKSFETQLKTGITESLHEPLMKITHKLLIRGNSTLEELTPQEQQLWNRFTTDDIYQFLTGVPDTIPEFHFNWTSVPRLQPLRCITMAPAPHAPAPVPMQQQQQQQQPQVQQPPSDTSSSSSSSSSSPHSSPTPSTSGTRPKTNQSAMPKTTQEDPSGASTSGTTPPADQSMSRNLQQCTKVDYKVLHTGASQFGCEQVLQYENQSPR